MKRVLVAESQDGTTIAVLSDNGLEDQDHVPTGDAALVGNIYKATVVGINDRTSEAEINFGGDWSGTLHASNVNEAYGASRRIGELLSEGQQVIVQFQRDRRRRSVILTTELSLPGRYLVLMPGSPKTGISKKIVDPAERSRLLDILKEFNPPSSLGYVIRTDGANCPAADIGRDLQYLLTLWRGIAERVQKNNAPSIVHLEYDYVVSSLKDIVNGDVGELICDDSALAKRLRAVLPILTPSFKGKISHHSSARPLLQKHGVHSLSH